MNRVHGRLILLVLLGGGVAAAEDGPDLEPVAPMPRKLEGPRAGKDLKALQRKVYQLKTAREALRTDRDPPPRLELPEQPSSADQETERLRERLRELSILVSARTAPPRGGTPASVPSVKVPDVPPVKPSPPQMKPVEQPVPPPVASSPPAGPLDALALSNSLFSLGDYASALKAYRQVPLAGLKSEDRVPVQYLIATCLRLLGKVDEAANLYREVAASKGDEFFAENAQWQVASIRWRQDLETRLKDVQARRQALGGKK